MVAKRACLVMLMALAMELWLSWPAPVIGQAATPDGHAIATPDAAGMMAEVPDRFARPTLPASPSQADLGSQVYWLRCMVCHGDHGQGLTDEFRAAWPVVDQNCWRSGCHAVTHLPGRFSFPRQVPAVVGKAALAGFQTAADLQLFIAAKMPYQAPGVLDEEAYWQLTAFLARENGADPGARILDARSAPAFAVHARPTRPWSQPPVLAAAALALFVSLWMWLRRRRKQPFV